MVPKLKAVNAATYIHNVKKGDQRFYSVPVEDPVFSAHRPVVYLEGTDQMNVTSYRSDEPSTLIGCAVQVS
jgi:hypothetical protein